MQSDIYVIGGGASLRGFDFSVLDGRFKIGANGCAIHANAQIMVSMDFNFIKNHLDAKIPYKGERHFVWRGLDVPPPSDGVTWYKRKNCHGKWWTLQQDELGGYSSGFAAFMMALRMKPQRVHLLGIDMQANGWFHDDYTVSHQRADNMLAWAEEFDIAAERLGGIEVYNYSPISRITAYEKRPLCTL